MFKKISPSDTCSLRSSSPVTTMAPVHLWWLFAHKGWAETVHWFGLHPWLEIFARVCMIARDTCNVQLISPQLAASSFRRSGASKKMFACPDRITRSWSRCRIAWTCIHTYINTYRLTDQANFFTHPPGEIFDHNTFNAKILKPLPSTI